jgi:hypothetical protein
MIFQLSALSSPNYEVSISFVDDIENMGCGPFFDQTNKINQIDHTTKVPAEVIAEQIFLFCNKFDSLNNWGKESRADLTPFPLTGLI